MKYILVILSIFLFFTGCQNSNIDIPNLKTYNSFDKFNYSKENINFFEKEFENILSIENIEILKQYKKFYKKNSNYFLNGKQKLETITNRISKLEKNIDVKSDLQLLEKAKQADKKEAIKIYKELAKKNNLQAQRELVDIYKINNPEESLKWLEKLVENEDIYSMKEYASANIYMVRPIIVQDLEKALSTYERLSKLGELSSTMRLGNIYEYGYHKQIAQQDKEKSLEYYELAASKNYKIAQKKLYKIYSCKKCKPNRYNPKRAKELQKILIKDLNKKIITELAKKKQIVIPKKLKNEVVLKEIDKKEEKTEIKEKIEIKKNIEEPKIEKDKEDKEVKQIISEPEPTIIAKQNKIIKKRKKFEVIKCYDMEIASERITDNCKSQIQTILKNRTNILKIILLPVLDKNDIAYFKDDVKKKSLLDTLGKNRTLEIEKYLKETVENTTKIKTHGYHVISKKSNKGVILKFY